MSWQLSPLPALALLVTSACTADLCELDTDCLGEAVCSEGQCVAVLVPTLPPHVDLTDGSDAPLGSGRAFIIDELAIMDAGQGLDVDGQCRAEGDCIDNALFRIGQLGNDQIRQGLLGGETLLVFEIAGIDEPFYGDDQRVSFRTYGVRDADEPFFPANNFQIPQGETTCCEFRINREALVDPEGKATSGPGSFDDYVFNSRSPTSLAFLLTTGDPPYPSIELEAVRVEARLERRSDDELYKFVGGNPHGDQNLVDVVLGGAFSIRAMARIPNPLCKTLNQLCPRQLPDSSILDLVVLSIAQPDIDLDGDGLEQIELGAIGRVTRCIDGDGSTVEPLDRAAPWTCADTPEMADGFSVAIRMHGVPAKIVE